MKTIYVPDDAVDVWEAAADLANKRKLSMSKLVSNLLRDYVRNYSAAAKAGMGLPPGFAVPASLKSPEQLANEQIADEIRDLLLERLNEKPES